ncbi:hypothetical protein CGH64_13990, partial [Vibrio parahaemolyticus]|uniref:hypothetical protein n=1 Tax=Vibrio parahaemolyticus TaxID=670 RepID=UPI00116E720F
VNLVPLERKRSEVILDDFMLLFVASFSSFGWKNLPCRWSLVSLEVLLGLAFCLNLEVTIGFSTSMFAVLVFQ